VRTLITAGLLVSFTLLAYAADPECKPLPQAGVPEGLPPLKPERVKISKWKGQQENPGEFRIYTHARRPDGWILKPPIVVKTEPNCFEVPVMEDAVWNPQKATLTFWPDSKTPSECRVLCMGGQ
jgi:hypothetical protein